MLQIIVTKHAKDLCTKIHYSFFFWYGSLTTKVLFVVLVNYVGLLFLYIYHKHSSWTIYFYIFVFILEMTSILPFFPTWIFQMFDSRFWIFASSSPCYLTTLILGMCPSNQPAARISLHVSLFDLKMNWQNI